MKLFNDYSMNLVENTYVYRSLGDSGLIDIAV